MGLGWDDEIADDDTEPRPPAPSAAEFERLVLRAQHYGRLLRWAKQLPSTDPRFTGGRVALMTLQGSYSVTVDAAGAPLGPIRFEPDDGKMKGRSADTVIIDDPDGPARERAVAPPPRGMSVADAVAAAMQHYSREPLKMRVSVPLAAAAGYVPIDVNPTLSIGNNAAIEAAAREADDNRRGVPVAERDNTPGTVGTEGNPAYFMRHVRAANWLCCVRRADGSVAEADSGVPSAGPIPKMEIKTVWPGEPAGRAYFYIDHALVAIIVHDRLITAPAWRMPIVPLDDDAFDHEAYHTAEAERVAEQVNRIMGAFCLPAAVLEEPQTRGRVGRAWRPDYGLPSMDIPHRPVVELRAQLVEAGAKMLRTCTTCRGSGGDGPICGTCRGSGSVAS